MRYHESMIAARAAVPEPPRGAAPKRPLYLGYCAQNPVVLATLLAWDAFCRLLPKKRAGEANEIQRVLITNWAHLGDTLIASSLVSLLQTCLPKAQLGFLAGSWGRPVVEGLSGIRWLHTVDHWR